MKTNDVINALNTTKETLRYYEKEELIKPSRNASGYREYKNDDLDTLCLIMFLRNFDVSISTIKKVVTNKKTITACLEEKKDSYHKKSKEIELLLKDIYSLNIRKKAYYAYLQYNKTFSNEDQLICELLTTYHPLLSD